MVDEAGIRQRYQTLAGVVDERMRRLMVAVEALAIGRGGQTAVAQATGVSRTTIQQGIRELQQPELRAGKGRIRRSGGGRKSRVVLDPSLREDLERLVEPTTRGDPESPLRWTCKSVRKLAEELKARGHQTSHRMVAELLHDLGYSLQANQKTLEGSEHPDRNAQFEYLNGAVQQQLWAGEPCISVDTKKKELIGPFKNGGRELRPKGEPEQVRMHDFMIRDLGRVTPYGVYDLAQNEAWVSVGVDHDTAAFAVESIRRWWWSMGAILYPEATRLLITADAGGQQWLPTPPMEGRAAEACGRNGARNRGVPLSTGNQQMEQDRAPLVLGHYTELARQAAVEPRSGGKSHRSHDHHDRTPSQKRAGYQSVPCRSKCFR